MNDKYVSRESIIMSLDEGDEVVFMYNSNGYDFFLINDSYLVYADAGEPIFGVKY